MILGDALEMFLGLFRSKILTFFGDEEVHKCSLSLMMWLRLKRSIPIEKDTDNIERTMYKYPMGRFYIRWLVFEAFALVKFVRIRLD